MVTTRQGTKITYTIEDYGRLYDIARRKAKGKNAVKKSIMLEKLLSEQSSRFQIPTTPPPAEKKKHIIIDGDDKARPTCVHFGLDRRTKYPGYYFCSNCDFWDNNSMDYKCKCTSKRFACKADHTSWDVPTDRLTYDTTNDNKKSKKRKTKEPPKQVTNATATVDKPKKRPTKKKTMMYDNTYTYDSNYSYARTAIPTMPFITRTDNMVNHPHQKKPMMQVIDLTADEKTNERKKKPSIEVITRTVNKSNEPKEKLTTQKQIEFVPHNVTVSVDTIGATILSEIPTLNYTV